MGARIRPEVVRHFELLRAQGWSRAGAAREVGVSVRWAAYHEQGGARNGQEERAARVAPIGEAKERERLGERALAALEDFELFRRVYLGHVSTPWQTEVGHRLAELRGSPEKEFVVLNCPPGSGKTTLFHDYACWETVRDRSLRGLIGSRKANNAQRMLRRIRRSLERPLPLRAPAEEILAGLSVDAEASLPQDFGAFKPDADVWRGEEFIVAQVDDVPIEEKEPTWSSYGVDSGVLGNRFDLIFWDDLVDRTNNRTVDTRQGLEELWDSELETRLEPGGLLVLIGQRLGGGDLYAYCRAKHVEADEGEDEGRLMYHRIVYPAHDEDRCEGVHARGEAQAWPQGCLLDPHRLPWRDLQRQRSTNRTLYEVSYQQRDVDPEGVLVNPVWVKGGRGPDGTDHPGCWDSERGLNDRPLVGEGYTSVITVDPSPTKYWAVQWWVTPAEGPVESRLRYLMDVYRQKMTAPELLYAEPSGEGAYRFSGMLEAWRHRAKDVGLPLTHVVIEENAAQRFFTQQPYFRHWCSTNRVTFRPHQCVDADTEVLSKRGWLRSHEVVVGDEILTLNMDQGRSEWAPVEFVYRGHHDGPMLRFQSRTLDALCTTDHRWAVTDQTLGPLALREARDLTTAQVIPLARPALDDPEPLFTDDFVELVAWAVTEGHFRKRGTGIAIGQSERVNAPLVGQIRGLLKRLTAQWHESVNHPQQVRVFTVTGTVASAVRQVTGGTKSLPPWFVPSLTAAQRAIFRRTMVDADGWRQGRSTESFCSDDESLITAFETACALDGVPTYRTTRKDRPHHKVVRPKVGTHAYLQTPGNRPVEVDYSGEVWCPNTRNGTFYARRGGKTYFTGNTHRNKHDPTYGVESLATLWKYGLIRLPGKANDPGRTAALKLVDEVQKWPGGSTDDCVMAHWFHEVALPQIAVVDVSKIPRLRRPTWMKEPAA